MHEREDIFNNVQLVLFLWIKNSESINPQRPNTVKKNKNKKKTATVAVMYQEAMTTCLPIALHRV